MIQELLKPQAWAEILVFAAVFYGVLNFVRGTPAAAMLKGIGFLVFVGFIVFLYVADLAGLTHVRELFQWILSGLFIAVIVIFAPEMRRALTRLSQSSFLSPLFHEAPTKLVDEIVDAAARLSKNRIGMLIAVERDVGLAEYVEQGVPIQAQVTRELLETLFYPGSALHDGAVVIRDDRISAAGCLFPLSDDPAISKTTGTRHRAAIGISEQTDAIAVIVSEETGRISVAVGGKLTSDLSPAALQQMLHELVVRADRPGVPGPTQTGTDVVGASGPGGNGEPAGGGETPDAETDRSRERRPPERG